MMIVFVSAYHIAANGNTSEIKSTPRGQGTDESMRILPGRHELSPTNSEVLESLFLALELEPAEY